MTNLSRILLIAVATLLIGGVYFLSTNTGTVPETGTEGNATNSSMLADSEREVRTEEVTYSGTTRGYLAEPAIAGNYPGVVMIHEWWGLNDNIKIMARELASEGYVVLAVDLYGGQIATTADEARGLTAALKQPVATENLRAAAAFLRSRGAAKVASLGWCFGGGQSLQLALSGEKLDATVIYYGTLVTDKAELKKISWPVLGIFGDKDASISVQTVTEFDAALDQLATPREVYIYPGVGHAFANPSGQNYAPNETKDAWGKTLNFLTKALKPSGAVVAPVAGQTAQILDNLRPAVKEFVMTSGHMMVDGERAPQFSLKEMAVKKGDRVRVKITNVEGFHDFTIDELGVYQRTPERQETIVEFTADRAGEFVYYCSVQNHRARGQWGTLRVTE